MKEPRFVRVALCLFVSLLLPVAAVCQTRPPNERPLLPEINNGKRLEAMLSIHAHALLPATFLQDFHVLDLSTAVNVLNEDEDHDRLAPSRRRRAIARLAAYDYGRGKFKTEIEKLGASQDEINKRLKEATKVYGEIVPQNVTFREMLISNFLPEIMKKKKKVEVADCKTKDFIPNVWAPGPMVTALATITVERDVDTVSYGLDPRNWSQCTLFWQPPGDASLAHLDSNGNLALDPPPPLPAPGQTYGEAPNPRSLHERFVCKVQGCDAIFENLLWVLTERTALPSSTQLWELYFGLSTWSGQNGEILGQAVTLLNDQGGANVKPNSSTESVAQLNKTLVFNNPVANGMTAAALLSNEVAGEVQELVCCRKPQ
jgi:hypothetical protein